LKPYNHRHKPNYTLSHPMRVRGLKPSNKSASNPVVEVAPHAGAWIETFIIIDLSLLIGVAPHAGAWIETVLVSGMKL
jgi:hypothetical protein